MGVFVGGNEKEARMSNITYEFAHSVFANQDSGMGLHDLATHNVTLLLRWWWRAYTNPSCLWTLTVTVLKWTRGIWSGPKFLDEKGIVFFGEHCCGYYQFLGGVQLGKSVQVKEYPSGYMHSRAGHWSLCRRRGRGHHNQESLCRMRCQSWRPCYQKYLWRWI